MTPSPALLLVMFAKAGRRLLLRQTNMAMGWVDLGEISKLASEDELTLGLDVHGDIVVPYEDAAH